MEPHDVNVPFGRKSSVFRFHDVSPDWLYDNTDPIYEMQELSLEQRCGLQSRPNGSTYQLPQLSHV